MIASIKNECLEVRINSLGAELVSVYCADTGIEYLCPKEKPIWTEQAPILFPFVGKLKNECFFYNGKKYTSPTHGFGRFQHFELCHITAHEAVFELVSSQKTRENYPFDFLLRVTYRLEGNHLFVSTTMENRGNDTLYYSLGFHPGFVCPIQDSLCAEDYFLGFDPPLTASLAVMDGYMIDHIEGWCHNASLIKINRNLFSRGAVTLTDLSSHRVRLCTDKSPHYVELAFDDYTELVIWTPVEENIEIRYVCIEPRCGLQDFVSSDNMLITKPRIIPVSVNASDTRQFSITVG